MTDPVRILLADDEPDVRQLIALRLRRWGYAVLETADGADALALIRAELPALAILDGKMPGLTGPEVTRALRADPLTSAIPVILLTASAMPADAREAAAAGADVFLPKPFEAQDLATHVAALLAAPRGRDAPLP